MGVFVFAKKKSEKKVFVKVCPNCLSDKIVTRIFDMGFYYSCNNCGFKDFYPLEFEEKDLKKILEKRKEIKPVKKK